MITHASVWHKIGHLFIKSTLVLVQYGQLNQSLLAEACFVVNVLDPKVKKDLLSWFIKYQLVEYLVLFAEDQEVYIHLFLFRL